jgi:hypothetical protein
LLLANEEDDDGDVEVVCDVSELVTYDFVLEASEDLGNTRYPVALP